MTRVALVTGSSRGIGAQCARALAKEGYAVCINCIERTDKAEALAEELKANGASAIWQQADVADAPAVREMVARTERELGHISLLVNNAGTDSSTWLTKLKQSEWDSVCDLNMKAPFTMTKYAIPHLLKTKGCVVNTASVAGVYGSPTGLPYPATKAALIAMTKSIAYSYADKGVRVNAVAPALSLPTWLRICRSLPRTPSAIPFR